MGKRKRFSATFKFNLVREALTGERTEAEIAHEHGVHPVTLSKWKTKFLENGATVFGSDDSLPEKEREIAIPGSRIEPHLSSYFLICVHPVLFYDKN